MSIRLDGESDDLLSNLDLTNDAKVFIGGEVGLNKVLATNSEGTIQYANNDFISSTIFAGTSVGSALTKVTCNNTKIDVLGSLDIPATDIIKIGGVEGNLNQILAIKEVGGVKSMGWFANDFSPSSIQNNDGSVKVECLATAVEITGNMNLQTTTQLKINNTFGTAKQVLSVNATATGLEYTDADNGLTAGSNININNNVISLDTTLTNLVDVNLTNLIFADATSNDITINGSTGTAYQILGKDATNKLTFRKLLENGTNTTYDATTNKVNLDNDIEVESINLSHIKLNGTFGTQGQVIQLTDNDGNLGWATIQSGGQGKTYNGDANVDVNNTTDIISLKSNITTDSFNARQSEFFLNGVLGAVGNVMMVDSTGLKLEWAAVQRALGVTNTDNISLDFTSNVIKATLTNPLVLNDIAGNPIDSNGKKEKFICAKLFDDGVVRNTYSNSLNEIEVTLLDLKEKLSIGGVTPPATLEVEEGLRDGLTKVEMTGGKYIFCDETGVVSFANPAELPLFGETYFIRPKEIEFLPFSAYGAEWNLNRNESIAGSAGLYKALWRNVIVTDSINLTPYNWTGSVNDPFVSRNWRFIIPRKQFGRRGVMRWEFSALPFDVEGAFSSNTNPALNNIRLDAVVGGTYLVNVYAGICTIGFEKPDNYGGDTGTSAGYSQKFDEIQIDMYDNARDKQLRIYSTREQETATGHPLRSINFSARDYNEIGLPSKKQTFSVCGQLTLNAGSTNIPYSATPSGAVVEMTIIYDDNYCSLKVKMVADNAADTTDVGAGNLYQSQYVVNPAESSVYKLLGAIREQYADGST